MYEILEKSVCFKISGKKDDLYKIKAARMIEQRRRKAAASHAQAMVKEPSKKLKKLSALQAELSGSSAAKRKKGKFFSRSSLMVQTTNS